MNDNVNHPSHYTAGKVECIEAIESATTELDGVQAYLVGNIIKYLWRFKRKNGLEDLRKSEWYLKKLIKSEEGESTNESNQSESGNLRRFGRKSDT